ncbi:hypothetical protein ACFYWY_18625 [Streptomyces sp. NPDC002870]
MSSSLRLGKVTPDIVLDECRLKARPEQEEFVAPVARRSSASWT